MINEFMFSRIIALELKECLEQYYFQDDCICEGTEDKKCLNCRANKAIYEYLMEVKRIEKLEEE